MVALGPEICRCLLFVGSGSYVNANHLNSCVNAFIFDDCCALCECEDIEQVLLTIAFTDVLLDINGNVTFLLASELYHVLKTTFILTFYDRYSCTLFSSNPLSQKNNNKRSYARESILFFCPSHFEHIRNVYVSVNERLQYLITFSSP